MIYRGLLNPLSTLHGVFGNALDLELCSTVEACFRVLGVLRHVIADTSADWANTSQVAAAISLPAEKWEAQAVATSESMHELPQNNWITAPPKTQANLNPINLMNVRASQDI